MRFGFAPVFQTWDTGQDISTDCETRMKPNPDIALIYHYDLARALAGEVVDWQAIPVNVQAGREGGDLCRAAADFGKRRDLFAMPAPVKVEKGINVPPIGTSATIAVPVSPVTVEQPAVDPRPDTASPPAAVSAADRERDLCTYGRCWCGEPRHSVVVDDPNYQGGKLLRLVCYAGHDDYSDRPDGAYREHLRARMQLLVLDHPNAETLLRRNWPEGVPTLKHPGHTDEQLQQILAAVRRVEAEVGAGWHPDDSPDPHSAKAIRRAVDAWAGRDPGTAWFAASLIATFEQCRNADATFEDLVSQFTIEQADRLHDAAQGITP